MSIHADADPVPPEFEELWREAASIWETRQNDASFEGYVSANYAMVYRSLQKFQNRCVTFLEWGSGLGVVTIMAAQMGFDAYGIEIEPELVAHADELAERFGSNAKFACGSFIPADYEEDSRDGAEFYRTITDSPSGYEALDMELRDFDLVYAYPWPEEHIVFRRMMRRFGASSSVLVCYDQREGMSVIRFGKKRR